MLMAVFGDKRRIMGQETPSAAQLLQQAQQNQQLLQQATGAPTNMTDAQARLTQQFMQQQAAYNQAVGTVTDMGAANFWIPVAIGAGVLGLGAYLLLKKK